MRWWPLVLVLVFFALAPPAYAAGMDANPTLLTFTQDVNDGPSAVQTSVVTNNTGSPVGINVTGPSKPEFTLLHDDLVGDCSNQIGLFTGGSCRIRVQFDPSADGTITDTVVVSDGMNDATVDLSGTGTHRALTASPTPIAFGQQSIGAGPTAVTEVKVSNAGTGPTTLGTPAISGPDASQFELAPQPGDCPSGGVLPQHDDFCLLHLRFDPSSFGDKSAHLDVASNAPLVQVDLTGTGIQAQLSRAPDTLDFGAEVGAGPSAPQTATITNVGSEAVPISNVAISDPQDFSQRTGAGGDCTAGTTVPVGGTCEVRIAFDPSTKGPKSATVTVNSSAPPISIALNGTARLVALDVPGTLDFAALEVGTGQTSIETSTVTNTGTDPVTLGAIRLEDPDTARLMWARGLGSDCAEGRTLAAGETCALRIVFVPQSDGTKVGTMTVESTAGTKTLLITAAATPGLRIPAFSVRGRRTQNRRLNVIVTPVGGVVSNIAVRIKTRGGAVLGSGTLLRTGSERAVSLHLRSRLRPGTYVATASGRDLFADIVNAPPRQFRVR
jgi:hypothetical protein